MAQLSPEFQRLIKNIETGNIVKVFLVFKDAEDLRHSAAIFFKRAVLKPHLAAKFVETANIFYFIQPEGCDINFRKALVNECRKQVDLVNEALEKNDEFNMARATGTYKMFSELFNIGYILKGIVKKHLEFLTTVKRSSVMGYRCFYTVIEGVRNKILNDTEDSFSLTHKKIVEMIEAATPPEDEPTFSHKPNVSGDLFPPLNNYTDGASTSSQVTSEEDLKKIKFLVAKFSPSTNANEMFKEITENSKIAFNTQNYQKILEALIERAYTSPEVAESIFNISKMLTRYNGDAWKEIKIEDFKKLSQKFILRKIHELLENPQNEDVDAVPIINFVKKLIEHSCCSIGCLTSFIELFTDAAEQKKPNAPGILKFFMFQIKTVKPPEQIRKVREEIRVKILRAVAQQDVSNNGIVKVTPQLNTLGQYLGLRAKEVLSSTDEYRSLSSPVESFTSQNTNGSYNDEDYSDEEELEPARNVVNNSSPTFKAQSNGSERPQPFSRTPQSANNSQQSTAAFMELKSIDVDNIKDFAQNFQSKPNIVKDDLVFMANYIINTVVGEPNLERIKHYAGLVALLQNVSPTNDVQKIVKFKDVFYQAFLEYAALLSVRSELGESEPLRVSELIVHLHVRHQIDFKIIQTFLKIFLAKNDDSSTCAIDRIIEIVSYFTEAKLLEEFYRELAASAVAHSERGDLLRFGLCRKIAAKQSTPSQRRSLDEAKLKGMVVPDLPQEVIAQGYSNLSKMIHGSPVHATNESPNIDVKQEEIKSAASSKEPKIFVVNSEIIDNPESFKNLIAELGAQIDNPKKTDLFIEAMLDKSITCRNAISSCMKLLMEFSKMSKEFNDKLSEKMMIRCVRSGYDESSLSNLFIILCELYREDIFADDDFLIWKLQRHMSQIPPDYLSQISSIITSKIQVTSNSHVEGLLSSLDEVVHSKTLELCGNIHENIDELADLLAARHV